MAELDEAATRSIVANLRSLSLLYKLMMFFGVLLILLGASIASIADDIAHLAQVEIPIEATFLPGFGLAVFILNLMGFYITAIMTDCREIHSSHNSVTTLLVCCCSTHIATLNTQQVIQFPAKFATAIQSGIQNHSADAARLQNVQATLGCCGWTGSGGKLHEPLPTLSPTGLANTANPVQLLAASFGYLTLASRLRGVQETLSCCGWAGPGNSPGGNLTYSANPVQLLVASFAPAADCQDSLFFTLLTTASTGLLLCELLALFFSWPVSYDLDMLLRRFDPQKYMPPISNLYMLYKFMFAGLGLLFIYKHHGYPNRLSDSVTYLLLAVLLFDILGFIAHYRQSTRLLDLYATIQPVLFFFNILSISHTRSMFEQSLFDKSFQDLTSTVLTSHYLLVLQPATLYFTLRTSADLKKEGRVRTAVE